MPSATRRRTGDDVADVDPHTELDPTIGRHIGVSLFHLAPHFDGATHRIDHAGELEEQAVSRGLHDPAAMFLDLRIGQLASECLQSGESPLFAIPMRREYPATSAARIAASLRSTRSVAKAVLPNRMGRDYRLSGKAHSNGNTIEQMG
jgi:hypothetical protein